MPLRTPKADNYYKRYGPDHARAVANLARVQTYGTYHPGWRKRLMHFLLGAWRFGIGDDLD